MGVAQRVRQVGNLLYRFGFPVYRPLYRGFKSYTDRAERALLRHYLRDGLIAVDAGANIGVYSQFLSSCVGPKGIVHCFEPDVLNCARLRSALGDSINVRINEMAVSDKTGTSTLYISDQLNVDHRAYPVSNEVRRSVSIQTTTLDDYFRKCERLDFIKLDIQGYEYHALRGAERLLRENREIKLLLEFWPYGLRQADTHWKELITLLRDQGFDLGEMSPAGLKPFRAEAIHEAPNWYLNLFAARAETGINR